MVEQTVEILNRELKERIEREKMILDLRSNGWDNKSIAKILHITPNRVRQIVRIATIRRKLVMGR